MRLCVLTADNVHSSSPFAAFDPQPDPRPHAPAHHWEQVTVHKASAGAQISRLARCGFDAFVNLCDGAAAEDRAGLGVVEALERHGLSFTGAGAAFYEPDRPAMKRGCATAGIATPAWAMVTSADRLQAAAASLGWPVLVKHPNGYSSVGIGRDACCTSPAALQEVGARTIATYGAALLESFIEGREFTVLVAEAAAGDSSPRVWPPAEVLFPPGERFKHFDLKWLHWQGMASREVDDQRLSAQIKAEAQAFFVAMQGSGYARCDLRMDGDGRLYWLEINPNCGIFYPAGSHGSADEILARAEGGHRAFLEHILDSALRRAGHARRL